MSIQTFFGGRREFYRGRDWELAIEAGARDALSRQIYEQGIRPAADAIAARCNGASSWGGYSVWHGDTVSRVTGINAGSSERGRRLLQAVEST
ncbi:hypothetical protein [Tessaracoccus massiliensis]|uniref:hypothetical protein n=1 Tax=Tessaracoccus massiliensis TaxID=1522311 RepID=UPI00058E0CCA|nr:hypothetical protein [Tessaracoccus massiliensis]